MHSSRGQGAMEYLMSYGWAILAVMVVGLAIWQLGIMDGGVSNQASVSGFGAIKPIGATCRSSPAILVVGANQYPGLQCQFINTVGSEVRVTMISSSVNDKFCTWTYLTNLPRITPLPQSYQELARQCAPALGFCYAYTTYWVPFQGIWCNGFGPPCSYPLPKDASFVVTVLSTLPPSECHTIGTGMNTYDVDLDIEYEVNIGGVTNTKHSMGTVRIKG